MHTYQVDGSVGQKALVSAVEFFLSSEIPGSKRKLYFLTVTISPKKPEAIVTFLIPRNLTSIIFATACHK